MSALILLLVLTNLARADEGMWTFNDFPSAEVGKKYGFAPSQAWLDHVRLSSVRIAEGCSGSFVSEDGLVMTNHHCVHPCVEQLSTKEKDFVTQGWYAETAEKEARCPEMEVNVLTDIRDVTSEVTGATKGLEGQAYADAQKAVYAKLEKACAASDDLRCDVVNLYHGGAYDLYVYQRYQDVRLVFAPEFDIAFFGGDPDNFMFPRFDMDSAFVRVYTRDHDKKGGKAEAKPLRVKHWLHWSTDRLKEGDLTFVSGHPGSTARLQTVAQLAHDRDVDLPERLLWAAEWRGMLREFMKRGAEETRIATSDFFYLENSFKARYGMWHALEDPALMASKDRSEKELRAKVDADPALKGSTGPAWDKVADALRAYDQIRTRLSYLERGYGFRSALFGYALTLVRFADEMNVPNEKRLREYTDANLPAVRQDLASTAPVYPELEIATLSLSLTKLREVLGADDPFVKSVLGPKSPDELAAELVNASKLASPELRMRLLEGGKQAVAASDDPMIRLARAVDPEARKVRKVWEDDIASVIDQNTERIATAYFRVNGRSTYPDATFTLRLSYGTVKGYDELSRHVPPFTTLQGAFDRATGRDPFALPKRWIDAKDKLKLDTPFDMATDNDIVGGNSGSPVVGRNGRIVGLVFDGNIQSLGGDFWFDERVNRTVAVTTEAITEALDKVYAARRLVDELKASEKAKISIK
jgi:hypothetical protein